MKALPAALLTVTLVACASQPVEPTTAAADNTAMTCEREYRVGSSIPKMSCAAPKTEAERQQMREDIRNEIRSNPAVAKGSGGG